MAGLIAALKSPEHRHADDAARRRLIERGQGRQASARPKWATWSMHDSRPPICRARGALGRGTRRGRSIAMIALGPSMLKDEDPRFREQAVRMLGRDCRDNGQVDYKNPRPSCRRAAPRHLKALLPMADDPDAGVRRELILALRNLPTDQVGDALRKLAASWDGQDRWYLEALGLALEKRERGVSVPSCSTARSTATSTSSRRARTARSRCRRTSRSTATRRTSPSGRPTCRRRPSSKYLGLAWRLHCREVLPLLGRVVPYLATPDLQQAGDDILDRMNDPAAAEVVADLAAQDDRPAATQRAVRDAGAAGSPASGTSPQPAAGVQADRRMP